MLLASTALLILTACGTDEPRSESDNDATLIEETVEAISTDVPTATPTATALPSTPTEVAPRPTFAGDRPTLPPTWTPTATPTITNTPTITATPTATATPGPAEICEDVVLTLMLLDNRTYSPADNVQFLADVRDPNYTINLRFVHQESEEETIRNLPGGEVYFGTFSLDLEPGPGTYTWSMSLRTPTYDGICAIDGTFILRARTPLEVMFDTLDTLTNPQQATAP